jgi:EmrB/QacA subfamily drug resistance transporter
VTHTAPPVARRKAGSGLVLAVLVGAQLMIWIDNTILNVALKTLADPVQGLGASPEALEWSLNSYTLAFAALMLTGGALGDRFGRRAVFVAGLVIFGVASAWAAWSPTTASLIAARAVMGVGSALVVPTTLGLVRSLFAEGRERTRAVALWSASSGLAIAIGPLLGGFLLKHYWWGSVFLVNVPVTAVAAVLALAVIPEVRGTGEAHLDLVGVLLSAAGLSAFVFGIIEGGRLGDWTATRVWVPVAVGLLVIAVYLVVELRARRPSFDIRLFGNAAFTAASTAVSLSFFGLVGSMFYSVFYLQGVRGLDPLECGLVLVPIAVGVLGGAPLGIRLAGRYGPRLATAPALLVVAAMLWGYTLLGVDTPLWRYSVLLLVQGLAIGVAVAPLTDAVVTVLPAERAAAGAAINSVLRQVGAVLGVAVLGSLLTSTYRNRIEPVTAGLPAPVAEAVHESAEAARVAARAANLPQLLPSVDAAYLDAMHLTTIVAAAVSVLGAAVIALAMPDQRSWSLIRDRGGRSAEPGTDGPHREPVTIRSSTPSERQDVDD